jgi:hypothetical protein
MRCAVVEIATGIVKNVAEVEDGDGSSPAEGFAHIASDVANIGDVWNGSRFEPPTL